MKIQKLQWGAAFVSCLWFISAPTFSAQAEQNDQISLIKRKGDLEAWYEKNDAKNGRAASNTSNFYGHSLWEEIGDFLVDLLGEKLDHSAFIRVAARICVEDNIQQKQLDLIPVQIGKKASIVKTGNLADENLFNTKGNLEKCARRLLTFERSPEGFRQHKAPGKTLKRIRLSADYDCFPLWEIGEHDIENIDHNDKRKISISKELKQILNNWAKMYDETLDRDDPAQSGFKNQDDLESFKRKGHCIFDLLKQELGSLQNKDGFIYNVEYVRELNG